MCLATLPRLRIERHFAQSIIHQSQTAMGDSEFRKTNRLRSEVQSDQACWGRHGVQWLIETEFSWQAVKTLKGERETTSAGLKPGVNETDSGNPSRQISRTLQIRHLERTVPVAYLSRKWICANFRGVAAPVFEGRAGVDLEVIVADLARN